MADNKELRMDAYYYSFEPTGVIEIDRILSAVATAGKGAHSTEDWREYGFDKAIQDAANAAAASQAAGAALGFVNVQYNTYFTPAQFAASDRNTELLASGEVVRVFAHPSPTTAPASEGRYCKECDLHVISPCGSSDCGMRNLAPASEQLTDHEIFAWAEGYQLTYKGNPHKMTFARHRFVEAVRTILSHSPAHTAAQVEHAYTRGRLSAIDDYKDVIKDTVAAQVAAPRHDGPAAFKNFHRSLCARFGYTHDEAFWWRDQVSLEEHIVAQVAASVELSQLQVRALVEENRQLAAKANEWRDKLTASEEARAELLAAFNREVSGATFMGEPALPPRPDVSEMVNRFLGWRLPDTFGPDCGISFDGRKDDEWNKNKTWPVGTNLFTADEAKAMFLHCIPPIAQVAASKPAASLTEDEMVERIIAGEKQWERVPAAANGEAFPAPIKQAYEYMCAHGEYPMATAMLDSLVPSMRSATPPAQAPAELTFDMSSEKMFFAVGNQRFVLDYEPDSDVAFKYMADMLTKAIRRAQLPATGEVLALLQDIADFAPAGEKWKDPLRNLKPRAQSIIAALKGA